MPRQPADDLVFLPLGGAGEIGMNCALYGFGSGRRRKWLMVDLGLGFADGALPGIDIVLPDIAFAESVSDDIVGLVLTHGHEDHLGAVLDLAPRLGGVPIFATPFTAALLGAKAGEERWGSAPSVDVIPSGGRLRLDPFDIEFVPVAHSIPESHALAIRTAAGLVLHSGDWKLDPDPVTGPPTDLDRLEALGEEGVDVLVCDSTNAIREGVSPSERDIADELERLIVSAPHRVAVTIFASNVARIRAVAEAAARTGRHVVPVGRAMHRVIQVARETGYLDGLPPFVDAESYGYLPRETVVALCTGSQGESRAALARIAADDHPSITLTPGDRVIFSSRAIPGNERAVNDVINGLVAQGVEIVTDRTHPVHVTGHPRRGELREMYRRVRPRALVPVHGEELHMAEHAALARECGVPEAVLVRNGDIMRLLPGPLEVVGEFEAGRLVKDGMLVLDIEDEALRQRRRLSFAGHVAVALVLGSKGELAGEPRLALTGLPESGADGRDLAATVLGAVHGVLDSLPKARRRDADLVVQSVRRGVRASVNAAWGKKPLCDVLVSRV